MSFKIEPKSFVMGAVFLTAAGFIADIVDEHAQIADVASNNLEQGILPFLPEMRPYKPELERVINEYIVRNDAVVCTGFIQNHCDIRNQDVLPIAAEVLVEVERLIENNPSLQETVPDIQNLPTGPTFGA